jgi:Rrf2 family protein
MDLSKTAEYALRIMSYMATDESKLYSANELYDKLKIPFRYLRKQLTILSKSELMESVQGKDGGYRISKNINEISLLEIVNAAGEVVATNTCFFGFGSCALTTKCAMHDKWFEIQENINKVLKTTYLSEIKKIGLQNII